MTGKQLVHLAQMVPSDFNVVEIHDAAPTRTALVTVVFEDGTVHTRRYSYALAPQEEVPNDKD